MQHINKVWQKKLKIEDVDIEIPNASSLLTTTVVNVKIGGVEEKNTDNSGLVTDYCCS